MEFDLNNFDTMPQHKTLSGKITHLFYATPDFSIRAHNQGQVKFYHTVGVEKAIWQTAEDERTCPECAPLDGQVYELGKFTAPPRHSNCRCFSIPEIPDNIKTPQEIEKLANKK